MAGRYPKREQFFAHRFTRLLTKTAVAQELGPQVCFLLTVIAHQEDAKRYTGAVTFWNEQLMPLVGTAKWRTLDRFRKVAVEAGWLYYENRGKRKPGVYWVLIPAWAEPLTDAAVDEGISPQMDYKGGHNGGHKGGDNDGHKRGHSSTLTLTLSLNPEDPPTPLDDSEPESEGGGTDEQCVPQWQTRELDDRRACVAQPDVEILFLAAWEAAEGRKRYERSVLTEIRRRQLMERCVHPDWDWQAALAKFPLKSARDGPDGWLPTVEWFLREGTVEAVLEGKYDFRPDNRRGGGAGRKASAGAGPESRTGW